MSPYYFLVLFLIKPPPTVYISTLKIVKICTKKISSSGGGGGNRSDSRNSGINFGDTGEGVHQSGSSQAYTGVTEAVAEDSLNIRRVHMSVFLRIFQKRPLIF